MLTQCPFLTFSEVEVSRHRDAIDVAADHGAPFIRSKSTPHLRATAHLGVSMAG